MKKLLGLLAAFGLTASASTAVIACDNGDKPEANKKVSVNLTVTLEEGKTEAEAKTKIEALSIKASGLETEKEAKSEAAAIAAVEGLEEVKSATKKVAAKDDAVVFDITVEVEFTVEKPEVKLVDIKDVTVVVEIGDDKDAVEGKILAEIIKLEGAEKATKADFTFTLKGEAVEASEKIVVTAAEASTLITGSFEITAPAE
ncbi:hypothetical protein SSABA_v1c05410 [Spiroplasma sabaudiense Ar-1343]|uniref:Lipoprotein n=1 Tax=Spiroplasma sabaudiense Ar-1343 TaxID=1276257 RepID=W6A9U5_9MOLU|nr:lipoprotein [Spiroplasma sabaudiense]AHI53948.1 hypothetical protein SSABA_v1c05410 [Spiroplasma sabaudiense Ar-1343]